MTTEGNNFAKGRAKTGGRKKGTPNKLTGEVRQMIETTAKGLGGNFMSWLQDVSAKDPARACEIYLKMLEYHIPKLSRTDHISSDHSIGTTTVIVQTPDWFEGSMDGVYRTPNMEADEPNKH